MLDDLFDSTDAFYDKDVFYHTAKNNEAIAASQQAKNSVSAVRVQNEALKFDVEKLFMITEALWEILKHEHGYTNEQLTSMIQDIDMKDGKLDGKVAKTGPANCSSCNRVLIERQAKCLYCGIPVSKEPFER